MLSLTTLISMFVSISAVSLVVVVTYYVRPSRGRHADPRGAAITVATLYAQQRRSRLVNQSPAIYRWYPTASTTSAPPSRRAA